LEAYFFEHIKIFKHMTQYTFYSFLVTPLNM
jgi:hypothetical protein